MPTRNFDLKLSGDKQHGYYVEVLNSPQAIRSNPHPLELPEEELEQWRYEVEKEQVSRETTGKLGRNLYQALFPPKILSLWTMSKSDASQQNPLRLRLDIRSPELAVVPWEIIHDGSVYLALTAKLPLARCVYDQPLIQLAEDTRPLNILLLVSTPHDAPPLPNIEREIDLISRGIESLKAAGKVGRLDLLRRTTRERLQSQLAQNDYQVLHYMGHGEFAEDKGYLILEDESGRATRVSGEIISYYFQRAPLRLLFLNACQTAVPSQSNSLLGVAQAALAAGFPAQWDPKLGIHVT